MEGSSSNNEEESPPSAAGGSSSPGSAGRRWTCEACGCNTNSESDRSCTICGTSQNNGTFVVAIFPLDLPSHFLLILCRIPSTLSPFYIHDFARLSYFILPKARKERASNYYTCKNILSNVFLSFFFLSIIIEKMLFSSLNNNQEHQY